MELDRERMLDGLAAVRETGAVNMLDRQGVVEMLDVLGYEDEAAWLADRANRNQYMPLLNEMGARLSAQVSA